MEIDCIDDVFESSNSATFSNILSSLPMTSLNLSSQCSSDVSVTPEKCFSTQSPGREKLTELERREIEPTIKKIRVDDDNFRESENEIRLERFDDDYEIHDFHAKHKQNRSRLRMMLKNPDKRAEYIMQQIQAMTERLKDPDKRAKHNKRKSDKLKDPSIRDKHNSYVLEKYRVNKEMLNPLALIISFKYLKVRLSFVVVVDVFISGELLLF